MTEHIQCMTSELLNPIPISKAGPVVMDMTLISTGRWDPNLTIGVLGTLFMKIYPKIS